MLDRYKTGEQVVKNITLFLMAFALSSVVSNALISIAMGLGCLDIIIAGISKKRLPTLNLCGKVKYSYWLFIGLVMLASLLTRKGANIDLAWDYFYWSIPFWIILFLHPEQDNQKFFTYGLIFSTLFTSLYSVYQFIIQPAGKRIGGFDFPNFYAVFLILTLPFLIMYLVENYKAISKKLSVKLTAATVVLGLFALYLTGSRGACLSFCLATLALLFFTRHYKGGTVLKAGILAMLIVLAAVMLGLGFRGEVKRSYDMERVYLLQSSYKMWQDHKIIGVGLNDWKDQYHHKYILKQAKERNLVIPHNTIAWFFSATGLVGGIGYLIFLIGTFVALVQAIRKNPDNWLLYAMLWSYLAFSMHGMVDVGITMKTSNRLFFMLLGFSLTNVGAVTATRAEAINEKQNNIK